MPDFDLFVGGFPCQAFSIAGKRQGFEDTRGTLFFDVARILSAKRPKWFILENVKGLLNHDNGRTVGTIFRVLSELGYSVGWEVVNSCHICVPQNRERIFIIGCTSAASARKVFPIGEGTGILATEQSKGKKSSNDIVSTITANYRKGVHGCGETYIAGTLRTHKDGEGFRETESGLCPTIPARAREDGSGQPVIREKLYKIYCDCGHEYVGGLSDKCPSCNEIRFGYTNELNNSVIRIPEATKKGFAEATVGQAINLSVPNSTTKRRRVSDIAHTLDTGKNQFTIVKSVLTPDRLEKRQKGRRFKDSEEPSFTLTSQDKHGVMIDERIRRLTPTECERLQDFPDDWTKYGIFEGVKKEISDTQRYKCLGNAVTTGVITAIMKKIIEAA